LQVHGDVEGQPVEAAAVAHADAERGDLGAGHVHARRALAARADDVPLQQGVDDRLLDPAHVVAHAQLHAPQVEQRIRHDLARPVVGHLAAAVDVQYWNVAGAEHVFGLAGLAEGEDRIVFDQPQFVERIPVARVGEALHRAPDGLVGLATEVADQAGDGWRYSVHFTSGCERRASCAASYWARSAARKRSFTAT